MSGPVKISRQELKLLRNEMAMKLLDCLERNAEIDRDVVKNWNGACQALREDETHDDGAPL